MSNYHVYNENLEYVMIKSMDKPYIATICARPKDDNSLAYREVASFRDYLHATIFMKALKSTTNKGE